MKLDLKAREFLVEPGSHVCLQDRPTSWRRMPDLADLDGGKLKKLAKATLSHRKRDLEDAQERLFAGRRNAVLVVLQGLDACGKDSTIKHVTRGVNPAGFQVSSFARPCGEELDHHFLWRYSRALPARGRIGVFNRSYYEDVMAGRVHPEHAGVDAEADDPADPELWHGRHEDINAFEHHLTREGTLVVKCFLHVSRETQRQRLLKRLRKPDKHWKFSDDDLRDRQFWDAHVSAIEAALSATSTHWAPWHVVPADHKWHMRAVVAHLIVDRMSALNLEFPRPDPARRDAMDRAVRALTGEV